MSGADGMVNLASPRLGSSIAALSDEFFAPGVRMLADSEPVFIANKFDDHGKWMDGWETRRRREPGHDWVVIRLGAAGEISQADIDTRYFTGNYPQAAAIEGCMSIDEPADDQWQTLLPRSDLRGDSHNIFSAQPAGAVNWIRLCIYPDGGIARLRLWGRVRPDWSQATQVMELSSLLNGGRITTYNDAHYGDVNALLSTGRGESMGDGWETRRRREPGHDWIIIALGHAGKCREIEIDTVHFKGNCPESCAVQGALLAEDEAVATLVAGAASWPEIMPRQKLRADHMHRFGGDVLSGDQPINYARLNIYPDGGISRFRIFGTLA